MTVGCYIGSTGAATGSPGRVDVPDEIREAQLPQCVRDVLDEVRAARLEGDVICVAFRTLEDDHEIARMGPHPELIHGGHASPLQAKNVLVLSVTVTLTSFDAVRIVTHVLVTRISPRTNGEGAQSEAE